MKFKIKKKKIQEEKILLPKFPDINYDISIPAIYKYNPEDRVNIIQAGYAEVGEKYVSHDYNNALELLSKDTRDSSDLRAWKLKFKAYSYTGDTIEVSTNGLYPIIQDPESVNKLMEKYINGVNTMAEKHGSKVKAKLDKATGKVTKTGGERKHVEMDPKTGCRPGTTAQLVGTIMLKFKEGPEHRSKCLPLIQKELQDQGFDEKKAKSLAASWYSTLVLRKADIYGKFKTVKAAGKATKESEKPAKKLKLSKKADK